MRVETRELPGLRSRGIKLGWGQAAVLAVAFLVSLGIGYLGYQRVTAPATPAVAGTPAQVRRGTLTASVNTTGSIVANRTARLSFNTSGRLKELNVRLGEVVQPGQVLAKLDTSSSQELKLTQTRSQLEVAKAKLEQSADGTRPEDVEAAKASLASAQAKLNDLLKGPTNADLKAAEQSVASAQAQVTKAENDLAKLKNGPDSDAVQLAQQDVEKAKSSLWSAQIGRDGTCGNPRNAQYQCDSANASVMSSEISLKQAQAKLEQLQQPAKAEDLANAQKTLDSARAALASAQAKIDQLKAGPTAAETESARSAVTSAKSQLAIKSSADPLDLKVLQEQVKQAEVAVKLAQLDLDNAVLVAPFGGTVAALTGNVGEQIGSNMQILTLVDTNSLRVDTTVDETDLVKLKVGQPAELTFDAIPGRTLAGKVSAVSLAGSSQQGVVTYLVSISLDETQDLALATGMTANVAITTERRDNVLIVPNRAVRAQGRGRAVQVMVDGKPQPRQVQIGLANDQNTEITGGLEEGETVLIPTTTTAQPAGFGPGMGGMPGMGGATQTFIVPKPAGR